MNIPLDRLYHYINDLAQEIYKDHVIIYHFWPHGSKNISNLINLHDFDKDPIPNEWVNKTICPLIWCNDQEPLDFNYYKNDKQHPTYAFRTILESIGEYYPPQNLNYFKGIFEKSILLHSERRSDNLAKYQSLKNLLPVYYWSHAIIARDWFRYAEHTNQKKNVSKKFLIYNRAWSGTREYRLRFTELMIEHKLSDQCRMKINPIEPELNVHYNYEGYKYKNPIWKPQKLLENSFPTTYAQSHYSADFDIKDYEATDIEIVLETLFDDFRLHLTEKSLRPIACGQPFIIAGTHGSLDYLRSYGFKTFSNIWDESYDLIKTPYQRLNAIADLMKDIDGWNPKVYREKLLEAKEIAEFNRRRFFSQEFFDLIIDELKTNLNEAFIEIESGNNFKPWIDRWTRLLSYPEIINFLINSNNHKAPTINGVKQVLSIANDKLEKKSQRIT
jgi:hypothetical protein